jgi:aminoglycoside 6'-N-acetyltransferase
MPGRHYTFTRVTPQDLPMIRAWLEEPHVRRWWGDPAEQIALISGDLDKPTMGCHIVAREGRPFAYVQWWLTHPYSVYLDQPPGTRGIDQFIGPPEMIGQGHGAAFIGVFARNLLAEGASRVITDPDPQNVQAIRAYTRAGFHPLGERETSDGSVLLMAFDNPRRTSPC